MDSVWLILRLIHILGGVFWAGSAIFLAAFITPAARMAGAEGQRFMQTLSMRTRMSTALAIAAVLTVLSGAIMYWRVSGGLNGAWLASAHGLTLTFGALAGIALLVVGAAGVGRTTARLGALGAQVQAAGGPPSPTQRAELQQLGQQLERFGMVSAVLAALAVLGMAAAEAIG